MHILADYRTPADCAIENEEGAAKPPLLREAMQDFVSLMNRFGLFVTNAENPRLAMWQACFALGLDCCEGKTYEDVARLCGIGALSPTNGRAAVSKGVRFFQESNNLPVSFYMKSQEAASAYTRARRSSIVERNEELNRA